jgi:hypothetical protein
MGRGRNGRDVRLRALGERFPRLSRLRPQVKDAAAYTKALRAAGKGKSVLFLVRRGDNTIFLAVKPSS